MGYIFIGGCERSGMTLLNALMCADDNANPILHEASLFRLLVEAYVRGKRHPTAHGHDYFENNQAYHQFYRGAAVDFLEKIRERYALPRTLVLRDPYLAPLFPDLFELIPEARLVLMVRDPRDAIASMVRVGDAYRQQGSGTWYADRDMRRLVEHFRRFYRTSLKSQDPAFRTHLHMIRYEDLVRNLTGTITNLSRFAGYTVPLPLAAEFWTKSGWEQNAANKMETDQPKHSNFWGKAVTTEPIGSFRQVLSNDEVRAIERNCADAIEIFRYSLTQDPAA